MYSFTDRLKNAWNAFTSRDPTNFSVTQSYVNSTRPDKIYAYTGCDQSIVTAIQNRIAVDAASSSFHHGKMNDDGSYFEDVDSHLNSVLQKSANTDQTGRAFVQDLVMTMLTDGCAVALPVETTRAPSSEERWDILALRVGTVSKWYPQHVEITGYDEISGKMRRTTMRKEFVAIIENPFYEVMNRPNGTLQRLIRTLRALDLYNDNNVSGKLNLLIKLPTSLKSDTRQQQAEIRRKTIEQQLTESKYGIAYLDQAESAQELNRAIDNGLWTQAQDLTTTLFNQLGLTQSIFDGTASETAMTNYYTRTVEPILTAIAEEMERKFLTDAERKDKHIVTFIRDPFKNISTTNIANIAQTLSANEIMSSNEIRTRIGLPPRNDARADELINKQINKQETPGENLSTQHKEETPKISKSDNTTGE